MFATTALIDSGCTSSAISRAFVEKHDIPTWATAALITMYNTDGTTNSTGQITAYAERIDLAITNLDDRDIFLRHDWLARHILLINWKPGKMTLARCSCRKTPIVLPDAHPYD